MANSWLLLRRYFLIVFVNYVTSTDEQKKNPFSRLPGIFVVNVSITLRIVALYVLSFLTIEVEYRLKSM